jgi:ferritin-like metal-binding protein YciE
MPAVSLQDLFVEELRDMYDGEKRLVRALPRMAKAAGSRDLQKAFTTHLRETQRQVSRLEQVFRAIGQKARGKKCDGIIGIVAEGARAMEELDGPVLDAALIAGAQKVEHYEISAYGTLAYFADLLGEDTAKGLLGQTLEEEKATDEKLSALAKSDVNREALLGAGQGDGAVSAVMGGVRRAAASLVRSRNGSPRKRQGRSRARSRKGGAKRR